MSEIELCPHQNCEYVRISNSSDGGDSGGPYYWKKYDSWGNPYIAMLGTHSRAGGYGGAQGIASYEIHNWSGLYFDQVELHGEVSVGERRPVDPVSGIDCRTSRRKHGFLDLVAEERHSVPDSPLP